MAISNVHGWNSSWHYFDSYISDRKELNESMNEDRLADIRLKWVQTYNATTDNEPRTAAMRGDMRWLVEQLEVERARATKFGEEAGGYLHDLLTMQTERNELKKQLEILHEIERICRDYRYSNEFVGQLARKHFPRKWPESNPAKESRQIGEA